MIKTLEERKFVNEEKISKYLKCSMCLGVFNVPVRTKCDHLFCRQCIYQWMELQKTCPTCRKQVQIKSIKIDLLAMNLIGEFNVYCKNKNYGCRWQGTQERVEMHEKSCSTKEIAERMNLKVDGNQTEDEEQELGKMNNPGNILDRMIAKGGEKKEEILKIINVKNENTNTQNTLDEYDPLEFLEQMDQYLPLENFRRKSEEIEDLPKQQRDRKSNS